MWLTLSSTRDPTAAAAAAAGAAARAAALNADAQNAQGYAHTGKGSSGSSSGGSSRDSDMALLAKVTMVAIAALPEVGARWAARWLLDGWGA